MRIEKALAIPVRGGFFNDDLVAVRAGARRDGFVYQGRPLTPGFSMIRQPSEAVSVVLLLNNGQAVAGDGMSVEYSAAGGRRGRFRQEEQLPYLAQVCEYLEGLWVADFFGMCEALEGEPFAEGLHRPAALYAVSQGLLQAVALKRQKTCAEVVAEELGVAVSEEMIAVNVQCGDDRYDNVDKSILKRADVLPHGLVNDVETRLGRQGELLPEYVRWIVGRIDKYGGDGYLPEIHIDVYGLVGEVFAHNVKRTSEYIAKLGEEAAPYRFCLESPVLMGSREEQIEVMGELREELERKGSTVQLIVDEWANDLEDIRTFIASGATHMINVKTPDLGALSNAARAVLECWQGGVRPILGGSCTDTDQSARVVAQVALATRPAWVLARPGMGVDEGLQIVHNEMARTLAVIRARHEALVAEGVGREARRGALGVRGVPKEMQSTEGTSG